MASYNTSDREKKYTTGFDQELANGYDQTSGKNADGTLSAIADRISKPFEYDVNGDALYQQYKDSYTKRGQLAMQDSIGKASAMTGGYGNSYAHQVGQQTFNAYMQALNDKIPELYALAYDKHRQETSDLFDLYGLYKADDETKYGRHMDTLSLYSGEIGREQSQNWNKANLQAQNDAAKAQANSDALEMLRAGFTYDEKTGKYIAPEAGLNKMTPAEQYEMMQILSEFKEKGDNVGLNNYLTGLRDQRYISDEYMDELYETYLWKAPEIQPISFRSTQYPVPLSDLYGY